jgi:hypothetical protein
MKICPSCRQTYTDDELNFCLTDGTFLTSVADNEPKTIYMDQPRITNQTNWGQQPGYQPPAVWQNQQNIQNQPANYAMQGRSQDKNLATVSLVLGLLAVLVGCVFGGIPLGAIAVVTGVIALNNEKKDSSKYGGRGLAIAGIVTGVVGFLISMFIIFLALID